MGRYVDVDGVATWVDERGEGDVVALLHGGFGHGGEWKAYLGPLVDAGYRVVVPDRRGHGRTADTSAAFGYGAMVTETARLLEALGATPAHVVGFSDGANVGFLLALEHPGLVRSLVAVGGNFHHDGLLARALVLTPELEAAVRPAYARLSPDGPGHWPVIAEKTLRLWATEPTLTSAELSRIVCRTLVLGGDDEVVRLEHLLATYDAIRSAQLCVVPAATHGVLFEKPDLVVRLLLDFLGGVDPPQLFPVRRA